MGRLNTGVARVAGKRGFTLIELLVTMAVIAILAAVAFPSYTQYVVRGKRSAAQAQMMDIANREEQYLLANRNYADKDALESNGYALPDAVAAGYTYDVELGEGTLPSYTITFTPTGSQESDGALSLSSGGVRSPADKW
jgi:type IV pilus assembly protein PilE